MTKGKFVLPLIVGLLIITISIIGLVVLNGGKKSQVDKAPPQDQIYVPDNIPPDLTSGTSGTTPGKEGDEARAYGYYEDFSPEKLARAKQGKVVIFFKASWCPTCNQLDSDIIANLANIPQAVSILKLDYDREVGYRQQYGVTYQHTFVQVDSQGKELKQWSGSPTLVKLLTEIN